MVQSKAATVDAWMEEVEPERFDAIAQLRAACIAHLPGWAERMQWGMPGYGPEGGDALVSFNSQKNYIALYIGRGAIEAFADSLGKLDNGKGCIRYKRPAQIDFATVAAMLDHVFVNGRRGSC